MRPNPLPAPLEAQRFLIRARQYRDQAIKLADMEGHEPNWPKHFLMTHAVKLAITAYLVFVKGSGKQHDLMALYEEAVRLGLKSNTLVLNELPMLSDCTKFTTRAIPKLKRNRSPCSSPGMMIW